MPRFNSINFYQNRPKVTLFLPKFMKFWSAGGSALRPPNSPPLQSSGYALAFGHFLFAFLRVKIKVLVELVLE